MKRGFICKSRRQKRIKIETLDCPGRKDNILKNIYQLIDGPNWKTWKLTLEKRWHWKIIDKKGPKLKSDKIDKIAENEQNFLTDQNRQKMFTK